MNILNKRVTKLLMALIATSAIVACGEKSETSTSSNSSSTNTEAPAKKFKIGVVQFAEHASLKNCHDGFLLGLKEAGYEDGKNIKIDYQVAQADTGLTNQIVQNFASNKADLIVGIATPAAQAAYNEGRKSNIPVIFNAVTDPILAKLQNEDGSNKEGVTGTNDRLPIKQQLAMIRAFLPEAKKIGIMYNTAEDNSLASIKIYESLAPEYGFEIVTQAITNAGDVPLAAQALISKVDALTNLTDNMVVQNMQVIIEKAKEAKIPYFGSEQEQVALGLVAAEGLDYVALGKTTGKMAAAIIEGKKPEELPIPEISESSPFYNSKTLSELGLTLPESYKHAKDLAK